MMRFSSVLRGAKTLRILLQKLQYSVWKSGLGVILCVREGPGNRRNHTLNEILARKLRMEVTVLLATSSSFSF